MKTLDNKKVFVSTPETSKAVQEKAFKLGHKWSAHGEQVNYTYEPFLFLEEMTISFGSSFRIFRDSDCEEITAAEILAMDIPEPEETFYTFQTVLVRDRDVDVWIPDFFKCKDNRDCPYQVIYGVGYRQCIDYESNKHLAFTTDKP